MHEKYLSRCIQLAENGLGTTYPNPLVGSVIVCKDKIIGEGWHQFPGGPHAEVAAVNSVADKSLLNESTLYVNLEPCSHFGRTPPCADMIISLQIPEVVIGTEDPNPIVAGNGIRKLREAGIKVTSRILHEECLKFNRRFFTFHQQKRPYVILKWAESADGFVSPHKKEDRAPVWISNRYSRQLVHKWRTEESAVMVGTNTAVVDNPRLDARMWTGKNPTRVVIDRSGKVPSDSYLLDGKIKTIVICGAERQSLSENVIFEKAAFGDCLPQEILEILFRHQLQSVIIEGGSHTLQAFLNAGLWDEIRRFSSNVIIGEGTAAAQLPAGTIVETENILGDQLIIMYK